jgi:hypothetical protein
VVLAASAPSTTMPATALRRLRVILIFLATAAPYLRHRPITPAGNHLTRG